jgi:tRNA-splicing ligase RtcB
MNTARAPAPWKAWGSGFEETALRQMETAAALPVAFAGALMPDAHQGYGLPIGGVLATTDAVIPYAVGMDIACRMRLSVIDLPLGIFNEDLDRLKDALRRSTRFGVGSSWKKDRRDHPVMHEDWSVSPVTRQNKQKAWEQLGTSGSGNHFAEFGVLAFDRDELRLSKGRYVALLSHGGSRGTGGEVAKHYSRVAKERHPELPKDQHALAWLDLASAAGKEYWAAMELMGRYAAASHEILHRGVVETLGVDVLLSVENHHNFAWQETYKGRPAVVHRKGATPAHAGALGIIPGSMGAPGYLVRGKGNEEALNSCSHGAGRRMSRRAAVKRFRWSDVEEHLAARGVTLMSAGLDEAPMAYKDIEEVMDAQADLVERLARFEPKLVRMAEGRRSR